MTKLSEHQKIILIVLADSQAIWGCATVKPASSTAIPASSAGTQTKTGQNTKPTGRKNIVHASESRSLVRLVARGLVEWVDVFGERTPTVTAKGATVAAQLKADGAVVLRDCKAEEVRRSQELKALQEVISKATGILKTAPRGRSSHRQSSTTLCAPSDSGAF